MRAEQIEIPVTVRAESGKTASRRVRAQGQIPAVVYGRGMEPIPVAIDAALFTECMPAAAWFSTLIKLRIEGAGEGDDAQPSVMIKEVQRDLVARRIISVDFHRISLDEAVHAQVPVMHTGESPGVKLGGILEHILHEVTVECLPTEMPDHLEADVSHLGIGQSLRVRDLTAPPNVRIVASEDEVILVVAPPVSIEEAAPAAAEEGAVVEERVEPEVITERESEGKTT